MGVGNGGGEWGRRMGLWDGDGEWGWGIIEDSLYCM